MKRQYKQPRMKVLSAYLTGMIANSPGVHGGPGTANPDEALIGSDHNWDDEDDIWRRK